VCDDIARGRARECDSRARRVGTRARRRRRRRRDAPCRGNVVRYARATTVSHIYIGILVYSMYRRYCGGYILMKGILEHMRACDMWRSDRIHVRPIRMHGARADFRKSRVAINHAYSGVRSRCVVFRWRRATSARAVARRPQCASSSFASSFASMLVTNFDVESARVRRRCVAADDDDARGAVEVVESTIRCVLCVARNDRDGVAMRGDVMRSLRRRRCGGVCG
jgi:hypothetical protein